jgi:hypothetical protein
MNCSATARGGQAITWPELQTGPLIAGGVLIGVGALFALAGMIVAGTHVFRATRQWANDLDVPPSELAKLRWEQARAAATAGANSWREHPNAKVGLYRRTTRT